MDLKKDAEKAKNSIEGSFERGAEKTKKAYDNAKHDSKIEASKKEEEAKNKKLDMEKDQDDYIDRDRT